ncbi:MAG: hypothetical protein AAGF11_50680 [Myxococcota bacterium]
MARIRARATHGGDSEGTAPRTYAFAVIYVLQIEDEIVAQLGNTLLDGGDYERIIGEDELGGLDERDTLCLVARGGGHWFGERSPRMLAAYLYDRGIRALHCLRLEGADSRDYARVLTHEMSAMGVTVAKVSGLASFELGGNTSCSGPEKSESSPESDPPEAGTSDESEPNSSTSLSAEEQRRFEHDFEGWLDTMSADT